MLEVEDLHAYYGKSHILQGVRFAVGEGEIVALLGRNGAGRSTQPEAGPRMRLFWIGMDTSTPWPWIGSGLLVAAGWLAWRWVSPRVAAAWSAASEAANAGAAHG